MCISISMLETRVKLTFLTLITFNHTQFSLAIFVLALVWPWVWSLILLILILLLIASSRINMLIPHLIRRNRLICSFHRNLGLTNRTYYNIIVIYTWISPFSAFVIIWPPMFFTVHIPTEITLKRKEILLITFFHFTVLTYVSKFHFNQFFYFILKNIYN